MGVAFDYRKLAEDERRAADETTLLMVRLKHLNAAERWEAMAADLERCDTQPATGRVQDIFY